MTLYIGLMSGTSLDGVDGVLAVFTDHATHDAHPLAIRAHVYRPFTATLRAELLALNTPGDDELHRGALAANALASAYADVVEALLAEADVERTVVRAVGAHGQTVRHRPGEHDGIGYTLQLNAPALLAERVGIDVVADLRSRDVAAGGTGAPLVPAFHRALFARSGETIAVLNLGGIANVTVLRADGTTLGFDCGPANALLDHWAGRHIGRTYDEGGSWAASGRVIEPLLAAFRADPYFALPPPKSTGRDLFNAAWLEGRLAAAGAQQAAAVDVQATLAELTVRACAADVHRHAAGCRRLLVCGGGAANVHLMQRLAASLPAIAVAATDAEGLPANQVEASAFAWLAREHVERRPGNLPGVTGARGPRILGALYPA
jgi:anhydro-N-acetylmuramic acid kinase